LLCLPAIQAAFGVSTARIFETDALSAMRRHCAHPGASVHPGEDNICISQDKEVDNETI
jgi:5-enolpyruvylshikimate-3-phosphate synthase